MSCKPHLPMFPLFGVVKDDATATDGRPAE
jgi:hypothetical protein